MSFTELPRDIGRTLWPFLSVHDLLSLSFICKRWQQLLFQDVKHLDLTCRREIDDSVFLDRIVGVFDPESIDFGTGSTISEDVIQILLKNVTRLNKISWGGEDGKIAAFFPFIKHLECGSFRLSSFPRHLESLVLDRDKCPRSLRELNTLLKVFPLIYEPLRELTLINWRVRDAWRDDLEIKRFPSLEKLSIISNICVSYEGFSYRLDPAPFLCETLRWDSANDCYVSQMSRFIHTLSVLSKLRCLEICGYDIESNDLSNIVMHCPNLRTLKILRCTEIGLDGFLSIKQLPMLTELDISHNHNAVTDEIVATIATHLVSLRNLSVAFCPKITDFAIQDLHDNCTRLRELNISCCCNLSPISCDLLLSGFPTLTILKARGLHRMFRGRCGAKQFSHRNMKVVYEPLPKSPTDLKTQCEADQISATAFSKRVYPEVSRYGYRIPGQPNFRSPKMYCRICEAEFLQSASDEIVLQHFKDFHQDPLYDRCQYCSSVMLAKNLKDHKSEVCCDNMCFCIYGCGEIVDKRTMVTEHRFGCPAYVLTCSACGDFVHMSEYYSHMNAHFSDDSHLRQKEKSFKVEVCQKCDVRYLSYRRKIRHPPLGLNIHKCDLQLKVKWKYPNQLDEAYLVEQKKKAEEEKRKREEKEQKEILPEIPQPTQMSLRMKFRLLYNRTPPPPPPPRPFPDRPTKQTTTHRQTNVADEERIAESLEILRRATEQSFGTDNKFDIQPDEKTSTEVENANEAELQEDQIPSHVETESDDDVHQDVEEEEESIVDVVWKKCLVM